MIFMQTLQFKNFKTDVLNTHSTIMILCKDNLKHLAQNRDGFVNEADTHRIINIVSFMYTVSLALYSTRQAWKQILTFSQLRKLGYKEDMWFIHFYFGSIRQRQRQNLKSRLTLLPLHQSQNHKTVYIHQGGCDQKSAR